MGKHVVGKNKKGNDSHKYSPGRGPPVNKECEFCASPFHVNLQYLLIFRLLDLFTLEHFIIQIFWI